MNERIKELVRRAGGHISTRNLASNPVQYVEDVELWNDKIEKFAELIVQDMLRLLKQYTQDSFPKDIIDEFDRGYLTGLCTAQKAVKKHFGVEE